MLAIGLLLVGSLGCSKSGSAGSAEKRRLASRQGESRQAAQAEESQAQPPEALTVTEPLPGSRLPYYELKMAPQDFMGLERNAFSNNPRPATFVADNEAIEGVKVRARGSWSRSWPKKSFKITFPKDKPFNSHHSLDLNSGWHDPAYVREVLAYRVFAACGAPASHAQMVRLQVNGHFGGLYVEVEHPEKALLKRWRIKGGTLFKAVSRANLADERDLGSSQAFAGHYSRESQKTNGIGEVQRFCHELRQAENTLDFFTRYVDIPKYINYLAASVLTQNWDGYNKNHYLVYDGKGSQKWFVLPWDLDRTFGDHWNWSFEVAELPILLGTHQLPGVTGWNRLEDRFFSEPKLRARFLERLQELVEHEFTTAKLFPILAQLETDIAPEADQDRRLWPKQAGNLHSAFAQVKSFIERRRAYLLRELPKLRGEG